MQFRTEFLAAQIHPLKGGHNRQKLPELLDLRGTQAGEAQARLIDPALLAAKSKAAAVADIRPDQTKTAQGCRGQPAAQFHSFQRRQILEQLCRLPGQGAVKAGKIQVFL